MSTIEEWKEPDKIILLEGWARAGLSQDQIAKNMGIGRTTLYEWKAKAPYIQNAIKKGKEVVDYEVENALLKSALEGNITAQIFWLKNRKPKEWREKIEVKEDVKINNGILNDLVDAMKKGTK